MADKENPSLMSHPDIDIAQPVDLTPYLQPDPDTLPTGPPDMAVDEGAGECVDLKDDAEGESYPEESTSKEDNIAEQDNFAPRILKRK